MKKILTSAFAVAALTSSLFADCSENGCVNVNIDTLLMTANGALYIGTSGDESAIDCADGAGNGGVLGKYVTLRKDDVGKNAIYSLLLTYKTTNKPLLIRVENGSDDCRVTYITAN